MNKAFIKESEEVDDPDEDAGVDLLPSTGKNYITPGGYARLMDEFLWLMNKERPKITATVSWAAGNGDRSENGDYIYGKKRLREIDRRIRFLTKRLDMAEVVNPATPRDDETQIFFGATVTYSNLAGEEKTVAIVGIDEVDTTRGHISWISPLARALLKAREGDAVTLHAPGGVKELEILAVKYQPISMQSFQSIISR
jgi:transcription elongation factor GreB